MTIRCQFGNGACGAPATRRILIDSPMVRPDGSALEACDYCAEKIALSLVADAFVRCVITTPIDEPKLGSRSLIYGERAIA
jgi:hypothetical protein